MHLQAAFGLKLDGNALVRCYIPYGLRAAFLEYFLAHTIPGVAAGFALFVLFCLCGFVIDGHSGTARAGLFFIPVWLNLSLLDFAIGVFLAGNTFGAETSILLVVFGVPASVALVVTLSQRSIW